MTETVLYRTIACCVEHESPGSDRALAEARRIASIGASHLTLLHILEPIRVYPALPASGAQTWFPDVSEYRTQAEGWLESIALGDESRVVVHGAPHQAACEWAQSMGVELLVVGSHRGLIERMLLGSFAGYLAHHAPCPVLLVRPEPDANRESSPVAEAA